jgi:hypothetical protein
MVGKNFNRPSASRYDGNALLSACQRAASARPTAIDTRCSRQE